MTPKKLLIVGTGWGGTSLLRALRYPNKFDITIASTRDHMLFTPLLASTATGALEHRSIIEPIRPLATKKGATFLNAQASSITAERSVVEFEVSSRFDAHNKEQNIMKFQQPYDILVVSVGATVNTFNIPGVNQHAIFMKEARHARQVRKRMHDLFESAALPITTPHERRCLLTFVVCGAGPTGVELTAEIADWLRDMALSKRYDRQLVDMARVILVEASGNILSTFDHSLRTYALSRLRAARVEVKLGAMVRKVEKNAVVLSDSTKHKAQAEEEERIACGMVVWTAGVSGRNVIKQCEDLQKHQAGNHLLTDEYLLCQHAQKESDQSNRSAVFAIGDCARMQNTPLVPIAQVAEQQGVYIAGVLDKLSVGEAITDDSIRKAAKHPFLFASKGMLAYVGSARGVAAVAAGKKTSKDEGNNILKKDDDDEKENMMKWSGFSAWLVWRYAYFSKLGSFRNKVQVPLDWIKTALLGRDVSSF